jgi:hypothetical protein
LQISIGEVFSSSVDLVLSSKGLALGRNHTYRVSRIINAPLKFVYNWCTDFREDDNKIGGSRTRRTILQKTKRRVIFMTTQQRRGKTISAVRIVTLHPPNSWHLDKVGMENDEIGDYRLRRLGPKKTRLDMKFKAKYKITHAPTKEKDTEQTNRVWDRYTAALEKDYARTR